ncbi:MAG: PASTA domain-containing protein, partial [Flavisolibacter sp.]
MFKFITSRPLWANILFAVVIVILLVLLFVVSLNWITKHGESRTVPAVVGKNINDVETLLKEKGFD